MITQRDMLNFFLPIIESDGRTFKKKTLIKAKKAVPGTLIITRTNDGDETQNTAQQGDWLVENQTSSSEQYLIKPKVFEKKYDFIQSLENGWGCYQPKGTILAIKITQDHLSKFGDPDILKFEAPWKELTVLRVGDYLVTPPEKDEIYRIAQKEFGETYEEN
ncbi:hypothetical protein JYB62_03270 [Algoriphagus lutimaris]|uniref:hypothetical protein n=1 Tax=Algoriphagus lutimaris TaxID=613197 RepID=UPI00196B5191|nr:hypothetical protein [Algoriphagus lutimaris]MBN3519011.1 hypothetical protein [Algoriphagus lutimaris]